MSEQSEQIDPIRDLLHSLNETLAGFDISERLIFKFEVPVKVTLSDGREYESTVCVHYTGDGIHIPDPDAQARRLADEVKEFERQASE